MSRLRPCWPSRLPYIQLGIGRRGSGVAEGRGRLSRSSVAAAACAEATAHYKKEYCGERKAKRCDKSGIPAACVHRSTPILCQSSVDAPETKRQCFRKKTSRHCGVVPIRAGAFPTQQEPLWRSTYFWTLLELRSRGWQRGRVNVFAERVVHCQVARTVKRRKPSAYALPCAANRLVCPGVSPFLRSLSLALIVNCSTSRRRSSEAFASPWAAFSASLAL